MKVFVMIAFLMVFSTLEAQEIMDTNQSVSQDNAIVRVARLREAPQLEVSVFPNPSFGEFTVNTVPEARVMIIDSLGKQQGTYFTNEYGKLYIDAFLAGSYSVVIISDQGKGIAKLVVL